MIWVSYLILLDIDANLDHKRTWLKGKVLLLLSFEGADKGSIHRNISPIYHLCGILIARSSVRLAGGLPLCVAWPLWCLDFAKAIRI
jgi:hypothetical protein